MQISHLFVAAAFLIAAGTTANAQATCPEGRTGDGKCVNPVLANVMRHSTIIASQPKISQTSALNLPSEDSFYYKAPQYFEYSRFYGRSGAIIPQPNASPNPTMP